MTMFAIRDASKTIQGKDGFKKAESDGKCVVNLL